MTMTQRALGNHPRACAKPPALLGKQVWIRNVCGTGLSPERASPEAAAPASVTGSAPAPPCWGQNEETAPLPCPYAGLTTPLLGGGGDFNCDKSLEITYVKPSAWYAHPCRWSLSPSPQPDSGTEATTPCSDSAVKYPTAPYPGDMSSGREAERSGREPGRVRTPPRRPGRGRVRGSRPPALQGWGRA